MEAFFVAVSACVLLAVGLWAVVAVRRLLTLTDPASRDASPRRPGDD